MNTQAIVPCLWMDDQAQKAAALYTRIFPNGRVTAVSHYPQVGDNPSGKVPGSVLTVELEIAGQRLSLLNGGPQFTINPSISFFVRVDSEEQANTLYGQLAEGGRELMKLDKYPWSERYGWIQDKFGVSWQVITSARSPRGATIVPCLMFSGAQHGNAQKAIDEYVRIFPQSQIESIARYEANEGKAGTIKHGLFTIAGQEMAAMDSHIDHHFAFNEGISFELMCNDQTELDRYWNTLSEGGSQQQCGWLKDRFGVSWQVVPKDIMTWMTSTNVPARDRTFAAMMTMKKPDVATLQSAFNG
jgi:predicted 3-demethylubiquinone-9 3-methyltransferase (glyoxalase superfamily)